MTKMICKVIKAGHKASVLVNYIAEKSPVMSGSSGFGIMRISKKLLSMVVQGMKAFHDDSRACEARHLVFSLPKRTPRTEAKATLRAVVDDWIATYAPDRNWLLGLQYNNGVWHGHLAVANVGIDSKPIKLKPHQVKEMSKMAFTNHAMDATGTGKQGLPFYSKARRKLSVEQLAERLVMPTGELNSLLWERLKTRESSTILETVKTVLSSVSFIRSAAFAWRCCDASCPKNQKTKKTMKTNQIEAPESLTQSSKLESSKA